MTFNKGIRITQALNLCACGLAEGVYYIHDDVKHSRYPYNGDGTFGEVIMHDNTLKHKYKPKAFGSISAWIPYTKAELEDTC